MKILCRTLFDCTPTGITGSFKPSQLPFVDKAGTEINSVLDWNRARNQQRNFETVVQIISLRGQPSDITAPEMSHGAWQFMFDIDTPGVYSINGDVDNLDILLDECDGVPMIVGLGEQSDLAATLCAKGEQPNIWFAVVNR